MRNRTESGARVGALDTLQQRFEGLNRVLGVSLATLRRMKGASVDPIAREILGWLESRGVHDPAALYQERVARLDDLQRRFEREGRYAARSTAEALPVDPDLYQLGLLVSTITTVHRFEVLEELIAFLRARCAGPRALLAVGYGTGYELRWASELLRGWTIEGYDTSPEAAEHARALLDWFDCGGVDLFARRLPLDDPDALAPWRGRYGKVVLCEVLEHLDDPAATLEGVREILHPGGHAYLTMAVNLAQEDHVYLYRDPEQARRQVAGAGLRVIRERLAPMSILPFREEDRPRVFRKGNYLCTAVRRS